jgi:hypothetical protein
MLKGGLDLQGNSLFRRTASIPSPAHTSLKRTGHMQPPDQSSQKLPLTYLCILRLCLSACYNKTMFICCQRPATICGLDLITSSKTCGFENSPLFSTSYKFLPLGLEEWLKW